MNEHLLDNDELLLHVFVARVRDLAIDAFDSDRRELAHRIVETFELGLHDGNEAVENAVAGGEEMATPHSFWTEIKTAFEFPDYFGSNWDAFNDSFGDLELGTRTVVLWRRADLVAQMSLKLFAEGIAVLHRTATAMDEVEQKQLIIVLSGEGESFTTPE